MRDFRSNNRFGNKRDFGDKREPREMFDAICSNCGKPCKVPFRPTGSKPVLCSDCFEKSNPEKSRGFRDDRRSFDRPQRFGERSQERSFQPRESFQNRPSHSELETINAKLDSILSLLTKKETPKETLVSPDTHESVEKPKRKTVKKVLIEEPVE